MNHRKTTARYLGFALFVAVVGGSAAHAAEQCRGTKLLHVCSPNSGGVASFYYTCYAIKVPCSLQKYSIEGALSPFNYPIVSFRYDVPQAVALEYQLTER